MKKTIWLALTILTACSSYSVKLIPDGADADSNAIEYKKLKAPVAILNTLKVKSRGLETGVNPAFQKRFLDYVKEKKIFATVLEAAPSPLPAKYTLLDLVADENKEPHLGWLWAKAFLIAGTAFLATPVLEFQYDYESDMILTVTRSDGASKRYAAKCSGITNYKLFAEVSRAKTDLILQVNASNINSLLSQLSKDTDFFK